MKGSQSVAKTYFLKIYSTSQYNLEKVLVNFSCYLTEMNMSKKHCTIINRLCKSYSFQRSVISEASLAAFHTQR